MPKNIKDDFFASDYSDEFEDNKNEFPEDNVIGDFLPDKDSECNECSCGNENNYAREWNLELSEEDKTVHQFMIRTSEPLIKKLIATEYFDAMDVRFIQTFEKNAGVLPEHRNS